MPSHQELPTIQDHLRAYGSEINALVRPNADTRRGAGYDIFGGTNAVLFTREATRDRDLFRATYFDASTGDAVDTLIDERFGEARVLATPGTGQMVLERPLAGTAGSFLKGTRVAVLVPGADVRFAEISANVTYLAGDVTAVVPVRAAIAGIAQPLSVTRDNGYVRLEDPIDDPSWAPKTIDLSQGQDRESDAQFKARTKDNRLARRVGYVKSIVDTCVQVGAGKVALYASDFFGDASDHGINRCFVGASSFRSTPELVRDCRIAVDAVRMLGADLTVMGMTSVRVSAQVSVRLWIPPTTRNRISLSGAAKAAVVEYFNGRQDAFSFRFSAMRGAVLRALRTDVHSVDIVLSEPGIGTPLAEPILSTVTVTNLLPHYSLAASDVTVSIAGP